MVNAALRGTVPTQTLDTNLTATSHALFYVDNGTLFPNYPRPNMDTATTVCRACETLINRFGDVFDFITIYSLGFIVKIRAASAGRLTA